ncbi:MAG: hypothetical protein JO233_03015, partial [Candidatus Eremiobacteraeota bacterium]|nr:hypothetical protein [Candidatus Eremiobacteraeota bacterium]
MKRMVELTIMHGSWYCHSMFLLLRGTVRPVYDAVKTLSQLLRTCIAVAVGAALCFVPPLAFAATLDDTLPAAHPGSTCTFGEYRFGAVGNPIMAGPDIAGPRGNEVNDVQRVFYIAGGVRVGFAGWLAHSFDGRFAYTPAASSLEASNTLIGTNSIAVSVDRPDRLPLASWIKQLEAYSKYPLTDNLRAIVSAKTVNTALA